MNNCRRKLKLSNQVTLRFINLAANLSCKMNFFKEISQGSLRIAEQLLGKPLGKKHFWCSRYFTQPWNLFATSVKALSNGNCYLQVLYRAALLNSKYFEKGVREKLCGRVFFINRNVKANFFLEIFSIFLEKLFSKTPIGICLKTYRYISETGKCL